AQLSSVGPGYQARGDAARGQHHRGRRCEVLAMSRLGAEQKVDERIPDGLRRVERVDEVAEEDFLDPPGDRAGAREVAGRMDGELLDLLRNVGRRDRVPT